MFIQKIICLSVLLYTTSLCAHSSKMGTITGEGIHLKTTNHSFSGAIKNRIILGYKKPGAFVSELTTLDNDKKTVSLFKFSQEKVFSGVFITYENNNPTEHSVEFIKLIKEKNIFIMSFDGTKTNVFVEAEFNNGHFINPTYKMQYKEKTYSFKLNNAQACYGYSLHLIAMIMGSRVF
jgi:hypothetical protein